jgi:hypothetical protein
MSRTSRWDLCFEWFELRFPRLTKFLITVLLIGAYGPEPALIAKTQEVWSKRLGHEVTEQEARTIIMSVKNFLSLLKEIRQNGK